MSNSGFPSARIPSPLTALIARDGRVEGALRRLEGTRLLTLTGAGGCGKTRLAMEVARRVSGRPVAWVELAALTDSQFVADHVAATLGLPDRAPKAPLDRIADRLRDRALLLVLDNCEHVVRTCAPLVMALLRRCGSLAILATSREALSVPGESTWTVPPLPDNDAADLFVQRARAAHSDFIVTERNAEAISRICRRLDGLPLAIELAAARVRALDPAALAERLESAVGLLATGSRAVPPRHRTLRDTIDWSYRLLSDDERIVLRRIAVFQGTFALDAVRAVCGDAPDAVDLLGGLADKSLVLRATQGEPAPYRLLETVREYARERLLESGEMEEVSRRHAEFFVALAERASPALFGGAGDPAWMARIDAESGNLRAAHEWCEQQPDRLELSMRLGIALHWYWFARGRFSEGRFRLGVALTFGEDIDPALRGRALTVVGHLAFWQGDYAGVHAAMEQGVDLLREGGDRFWLAYALNGLGIAASLQGRLEDARRLIDDALQTLGTEPRLVLHALIYYWAGLTAQWDHDADGAQRAFAMAVDVGRRLDHKPAIAHPLTVLGRFEAAAGRHAVARASLVEAITIFREIDDRWGLLQALEGLARVLLGEERVADAVAALAAAERLREELAIDMAPPDRAYHDEIVQRAQQIAGEAAFAAAVDAARARSTAGVIDGVLRGSAAPPAGDASGTPIPALRVRALGPLEIESGGRRVERSDWGSSRARELLLFLLSHPGGCTRAHVGIALWPDASPERLRNLFHVTVHRLRGALRRADAVLVVEQTWRVNPDLVCEFDAALFEAAAASAIERARRGEPAIEALRAAAAWYRGDLLEQEPVGEWALPIRERLRNLHRDLLLALGCAHMEQEQYRDAAAVFSALLARDPVHEQACRRHMTCLAQLGDRTSALRAYDSLARALQQELGVRPGPQTRALRDELAGA